MRPLAILLALACASTTAWAQSKRYPKKPVDDDVVREQHSNVWDSATHPEKAPYREALDEAKAKLEQRQSDDRVAAIQILDHAISMSPDEPEAYVLRGGAYLAQMEWPRCADDLANAIAHARRDAPPKIELRRDLGVCQARAGRLSDAERTLSDAASQAPNSIELWMRLGETRIALGKLDEAKSALDAALAISESSGAQTPVLWLRAVASDRARQPGAAEEDVRKALSFDRSRAMIETPQVPLIGAGEHEYVLGLSYADNDPRDVELATVYFRRFLKLAPNSPWKRRAEEHLRDLKAIELPLVVRKLAGGQPLDVDIAAKVVRGSMAKMRACMAKLPGALIEVRLTRTGPRSPETTPMLPRFRAPPTGVSSAPVLSLDASKSDLDDAQRCIVPIAEALPLPPITDKDSYYSAAFFVIAP